MTRLTNTTFLWRCAKLARLAGRSPEARRSRSRTVVCTPHAANLREFAGLRRRITRLESPLQEPRAPRFGSDERLARGERRIGEGRLAIGDHGRANEGSVLRPRIAATGPCSFVYQRHGREDQRSRRGARTADSRETAAAPPPASFVTAAHDWQQSRLRAGAARDPPALAGRGAARTMAASSPPARDDLADMSYSPCLGLAERSPVIRRTSWPFVPALHTMDVSTCLKGH